MPAIARGCLWSHLRQHEPLSSHLDKHKPVWLPRWVVRHPTQTTSACLASTHSRLPFRQSQDICPVFGLLACSPPLHAFSVTCAQACFKPCELSWATLKLQRKVRAQWHWPPEMTCSLKDLHCPVQGDVQTVLSNSHLPGRKFRPERRAS